MFKAKEKAAIMRENTVPVIKEKEDTEEGLRSSNQAVEVVERNM